MNRAFDLLDEGDPEGALLLGKELEAVQHSSGFEIQALAHLDLDSPHDAIKVLERGVASAADVWVLWQLLGNTYSDNGRTEQALDCYSRALACDDVDTFSVHYNIATALNREGRLEEALSHLELRHIQKNAPSHEMECLAAGQRIGLLTDLGRHDDALREARRLITQARIEDTVDECFATVLGAYASALWLGPRDHEAALQAAWEAIELDRREASAMWVIRELATRSSDTGQLYRLTFAGEWYPPPTRADAEVEEPLGFFTTYEVVADSVPAAEAYARAFEPPTLRDSIRLEESDPIEPRPDQPEGVYWVSGYRLFPLTAEAPASDD